MSRGQKTTKRRSRKYVGPWFRMYASDLQNATLQMLPLETRWAWLTLACIGSRNDGRLPDIAQIAFEMRCSIVSAEAQINELIAAGMVEQKWGNGQQPHLEMVGWSDRQFVADSSAGRMRKLRERNRVVTEGNGFGDGDVTSQSDGNAVFSSNSPKVSNPKGNKSSTKKDGYCRDGLNPLADVDEAETYQVRGYARGRGTR